MRFRVIEGGRSARSQGQAGTVPDPCAVAEEAARRLRESGFERARVRALLGGEPIPAPLNYLQMQIKFASKVLSAMTPIPADFRDDRYWPRCDRIGRESG